MKFDTRLFRPYTQVQEKNKQGGNDEEAFVGSSNPIYVVPCRIRFARSRPRKRGENLQSEVRRVSWCERGRQAGHEVTFYQGQECRGNPEANLNFAEAH
jgi:hypothetical protein